MTIRDSLPVTDVGKPYKLALRAEATRDAVAAALGDLPLIIGVEADVENGSVAVVVEAEASVDEADVKEALGGYAVQWRLAARS